CTATLPCATLFRSTSLFRSKLPGMVVWGDGMITYNGREIPNVLVNGKPFFGSDKGIALQNIDKEAVKKLQVYDTRPEEKKLEDRSEEHTSELQSRENLVCRL